MFLKHKDKKGFPDSRNWHCAKGTEKDANFTTGFTLVEMLVSVLIITLIMATVLFNYSSFNDRLALSSAGQELALVIRQAQTYGLTVREVKSTPGVFDKAYGVFFDTTDPANYYLFADSLNVANNIYDVGSGNCASATTECIEKITLRNGIRITSICNESACPPSSSTKIHVTFLRPNPDARVYFTGGASTFGPYLTGKVILTSPKGKTLTITIESTGQVYVGSIVG
jgi:type II secretory pathway pseudopilin PulG